MLNFHQDIFISIKTSRILDINNVFQCLFRYRHCGMHDPSWAELRHFVNFLTTQLRACEESHFCNMALVGDDLEGFRTFVVGFMILMSRVSIIDGMLRQCFYRNSFIN